MTDWRPVGWVLLALGLVNSIWGAYELGAGGENSFLLLSGLGCLTIWLALHDELAADESVAADDPAAETTDVEEGSA